MTKLIVFTFIFSSQLFAQGVGTVGKLNQINKDPAEKDVRNDIHKLRGELHDLDKPLAKPMEKSPNEVQMEKEDRKKGH
jgi:hypothetical protein